MSSGKIQLTIATRNAQKTREFAMLFGDAFELDDLTMATDVSMVEETGSTFEENAILKANAASLAVSGIVLADDSGLEVDALGGAPGVYSARYGGTGASDGDNLAKLLAELERVGAAAKNSTARFRCVLALASFGKVIGIFHGKVEGKIVFPPRGTHGFGYDPVFLPDGASKTFAEMRPEAKNGVSHRAAAVKAMRTSAPELFGQRD